MIFDTVENAISKLASKEDAQAIANWIADSEKRFAELWSCISSGEPPIPRRAAWVLDKLTDIHPTTILPYYNAFFECAQDLSYHNGVRRCVLKSMGKTKIPEELEGEIYDFAIKQLLNPQIEVAIQVHCMMLAFHIAKSIPELAEELCLVIEDQMEYNSAGFKSRGKKILKELRKLQR